LSLLAFEHCRVSTRLCTQLRLSVVFREADQQLVVAWVKRRGDADTTDDD